jgi:Tol biopolymer transport system component
MPNGRIVYRSNAGGDSDIWVTNAHGSNPRQLTVEARVSRGLTVSSDGLYVIFVSDRGGRFNIWRVNTVAATSTS